MVGHRGVGIEGGHKMRNGARIGAKFRDQHECISNLWLTSRGREDWPDEKKEEQEYKLQDEKVETQKKRQR